MTHHQNLYGDTIRETVLIDMAEEVASINHEKGWYDEERGFGMDVALLHSEVSEMLEAWRDSQQLVMWEHADGKGGKVTTFNSTGPMNVDGKPVGIGIEAADVLIRLLDTCGRYNISLGECYRIKVAYNRTRPYRHGGKKA